MCGITGWVDYKRSLEGERDVVTKMAETLAKRGPDDNKVWIKGNVAFGHKRLIVVDPEGGKQPMTCLKDEANYAICYNGELYNTEDIRKELLRRGYTFKGHSDTEVLLASYIEWKEECVDHLNGIYAFAVWDEQKEQVFIARDRLGVKPLFYKYDSGRLLFGSELKAILAHPDVKAEVTLEGLSEIFGLGPSRTPGHGIYAGIKELRPGHAMTFSKNGLCIWRYWNVESKKHEDSFEETVEKTRFLLQDAITRQLVSDVPLCTFLSGGVDSSAITAIAAKEYERSGKGQLHTYSVDYEDNDKYFKANAFQPNSDAPFIHLMTETFQTIHHRCVISNEQLAQYLTEAVLVRDLPGMADIDSSLLWFCREIKQDFVVGLSGECADEIFGGYPWFYREDDLQSSAFPWMRSTEAREQLLKKEWRNKLNLQQYVQQRYEESIQEVPILDGESSLEAKRRQLFYLNMVWFMTTLLDRKDRMSMGASLEVRVPFADHRLVEYAWNIPWEMKMYKNREKGLLRKALEGLLPNEILYRKKSPYPKTHNPHYTKAVTVWIQDLLTDKGSILHELFDKEQLSGLIESGGSAFQTPWYGQLNPM
ncbi:asparagine synthase (glutamine-hydrolyzing) [Bacillus thuringiensis serovar brasilensis]|uniref:asparagine synthase (glutamine-hydrolyzing) n=1 Tax=Bacillus cereus group TaxID=86661 RepID=UPI000A3CF847|nr:asparagine synthase (glutamine-hydrolyzing) [Bacillus thuringiensis]MCU5028544.1 asparagine synthase (glutamine-hydrolyzing) [Bacillus cereus]MRA71957.1 asparagine synthase (glutamine-hydrolyzing) [Bacillus thuringiensis]MRA91159.1 asparagine synthase (glutamine-hydrolyzing) [Bacillus thuringiensis]MRC53376.1 asparagine synthase (glutamine-hydrolyzing) [Bacillus thuringiensis]OTX29706.1 asparagine synthase (glutamine-hydrolyzing) [Bacillus thuringiensis serovar brasilensis]